MHESEFWYYDKDMQVIKNKKAGLALSVSGGSVVQDKRAVAVAPTGAVE